MDLGVISVRYARALLKSATDHKIEDKVYGEMQTLVYCFLRVAGFRVAIDNPMVAKDKKQTLVETACGEDVSDLSKRFISLVLKAGREDALQFIAAAYITLYRRQKNIIRGKLVTAMSVTPEMEERMKQLVETRTGGTVEFNTEVDPDIIGGFILTYDTYRMDASVRAKLNTILTALQK